MEQHKAKRRLRGMQAKRDDDLKDSFYLYIMRNSIGAGLRSQYAPDGQMPDRLAELLKELNGAEERAVGDEDVAAQAEGEERPPEPRHAPKK